MCKSSFETGSDKLSFNLYTKRTENLLPGLRWSLFGISGQLSAVFMTPSPSGSSSQASPIRQINTLNRFS